MLRVEKLSKSFGERKVLTSLDLSVRRGEKIAIIGANGAGKTTLLRVMAGELAAEEGEVRVGNPVALGYYAQHHADSLVRDATAYQEVARANPKATPNQVRSALGAFLFSGDDVDKKISVLSGGERARVALARLLIRPSNLLLMDEPTNHLDLDSSDSLGESLAAFDGTLVFVSHNRSFIRRLATRIWNVENGRVETYPGTLDEYLYSCRLRVSAGESAESSAAVVGPAGRGNREAEKDRKRREAEARQRRAKLVAPIEKRIAALEERITGLERMQAERSRELSDPAVYADAARRNQLLRAFQDTVADIEQLSRRWEAAAEELARAEAELGVEAD
jgi:ATP-binding cassette subfamily F protein 3